MYLSLRGGLFFVFAESPGAYTRSVTRVFYPPIFGVSWGSGGVMMVLVAEICSLVGYGIHVLNLPAEDHA